MRLGGANGREVFIDERLPEAEAVPFGVPVRLDLGRPEDLRALAELQRSRAIEHYNAVIGKAKANEEARKARIERELRLAAVDETISFLQGRTVTRPFEQSGRVETLADQVESGELSPAQAQEAVRIAIELGHLPEGTRAEGAKVLGQSKQVKYGPQAVYEIINRLHEGADPLTVIEEQAETFIKLSLDRGELEFGDIAFWRAHMEAGVGLQEALQGENLIKRADARAAIESNAKGANWSERELIEWFSGQAQAYFVGRHVAVGWHSAIPHKVRVWLDKMREFLSAVFQAGRALMQMEAEGKLDISFQDTLARAVGLDAGWVNAVRSEAWKGQNDDLRAIMRGEASGIGDYKALMLSQKRYGAQGLLFNRDGKARPIAVTQGGKPLEGTYQLRSVDGQRESRVDEGMSEAPLSPEERAQLLAHQKFLTGEPVAQLTGEEFAAGQRGRLRFLIADWYKKKGASVVSVEGVGSVVLDARAVERSLHHGKGRPKVSAFAAVPAVLRKGRLIYVEALRGAKDGGRYLHIAAPIQIGGEDYIADVVLKSDTNGSRMYLHNVEARRALQHPSTLAVDHRSSAVAEDKPTGKQSASTDAGVVQTVLRRIFSVKEDDAVDAPSPAASSTTHQLRSVDWAGFEHKRFPNAARVEKQQMFEASGVAQSLEQELDARIERIRARQLGEEQLSAAAQPVAAATREAGLRTRKVRNALDRWAEPIARRMEKIHPVLGQSLRRLEFDMGRGRAVAWERVKPFADGLADLAKSAPEDYLALDLALKNGERGARDLLLNKHGLGEAWGAVELLLRGYHVRLLAAGFEVGFLENYFPRKVTDSDGLLGFYAGDEGAVEAINGVEGGEAGVTRLFNGLLGIPQNLKERSIWRVRPDTLRFYASPVEALHTYIEQVNEALALKAFFGKAAVFKGKVKSGENAVESELGELFGMDIGKSVSQHVERLVERAGLSGAQAKEVSEMLRARFNKAAPWKWLQGAKNITLLTTLGHFTTTLTQIGDLAFSLYEAGVSKTAASVKAAVKSKSAVTKEDVGIDAIAEGFKDPSKLSQAVDTVFKWTGFTHLDRVGKEAIMNAKLSQLQEEALDGELNAKARAMLEAWKLVPIVGRPYYWWLGGGRDKVAKQRERRGARGW